MTDEAFLEPVHKLREEGELTFYEKLVRVGTNESFSVGDFVYLRNPDPEAPPYCAQLELLFADKTDGRLYCEVKWFYRPEDTHTGRLVEHGERELFESVHRDINLAAAIMSHCSILTFSEYARAVKAVKKAELTGQTNIQSLSDTFFCQRGYNPSRSRFVLLQPSTSKFATLEK